MVSFCLFCIAAKAGIKHFGRIQVHPMLLLNFNLARLVNMKSKVILETFTHRASVCLWISEGKISFSVENLA